MAPPLRQLGVRVAAWRRLWPGPIPALTLALLLAPILAGLSGMVLPAFGWLPALGGKTLSLEPWRQLAAQPELPRALRLSITTGIGATALSLALALGLVAALHGRRPWPAVEKLLAPLMALPHAAAAVGLAFLLAPSGWLARLVAAAITGWSVPPELWTDRDPHGLALVAGLVAKEMPYLLLMILAALPQAAPAHRLTAARMLGYGPVAAWLKIVLPPLYGRIRLPIYAVLAYSLSVVDMAAVLAPATPPPLALLVVRWLNDPDLTQRFVAAAAASLQALVVVVAILAWALGERILARWLRPLLIDGRRRDGGATTRAILAAPGLMVIAAATAGLALLAIWSVAGPWRFPAPLPAVLSLDAWSRSLPRLVLPALNTLGLGLAAALLSLILAIGCLENEQRRHRTLTRRGLWLLYLPLLIPQVSFLFGIATLAVAAGIDGNVPALLWGHVLFVLPYVFLSLGDSYRALDPRHAQSALSLGASPRRVLWRIKLPLLARPVTIAAAIGFSVSVALYVPTLFIGGGRIATLATETVALVAGADRRLLAVQALAQAAMPLLAYGLALALSARAPGRGEGKA